MSAFLFLNSITVSLCESRSSSLTVWGRDGMERGISAPNISLVRGATTKSRLDRNIWKSASMSGGSAKRFSIENPGACPRRARDGWEPPGAWCLWTCTLVIDPLS